MNIEQLKEHELKLSKQLNSLNVALLETSGALKIVQQLIQEFNENKKDAPEKK